MRLIAVLVVVGLTGCATPGTYFTHPHQNEELFAKEQKECEYEALKYAQVVDPRYGDLYGSFDLQQRRQNLMVTCMETKGYKQISYEEYQARRKAKGL